MTILKVLHVPYIQCVKVFFVSRQFQQIFNKRCLYYMVNEEPNKYQYCKE